ncbi:mobilization protein [Pedobacter sp. ISL-68]|uniref:plasmid mobilization protein n=1 Tax=unclassified Pedobacter TaxID=2628915 RepID=UPI001BEB9C99|nr:MULTISPECIES: mobilization protein [unclassified Pedobacter]MBT2563745.1 mobilization protein [Pedobacter sp. ISL-64]MBT2589637.1 mobilization protein [Pedobacter sp. ISL-68]
MPRPKIKKEEEKLKHYIRIRVDEQTLKRLNKMQKSSDCKGLSQLARKILMQEPVQIFHRDISMNGPMEELAMIRKEIRSIGININQQTYHFHISPSKAARMFYAERTKELYEKIEIKIERLLEITDKLAGKWLQKSSAEKTSGGS